MARAHREGRQVPGLLGKSSAVAGLALLLLVALAPASAAGNAVAEASSAHGINAAGASPAKPEALLDEPRTAQSAPEGRSSGGSNLAVPQQASSDMVAGYSMLSQLLDAPKAWAQQTWRSIVGDKVWPPFGPNPRILAGTVLAFLAAALANAAGVGGGGLFVPLFFLLIGYDAKSATALSKSMVMGGSIASVYFNIRLKHPDKPCSLIDYDVARLMQPMLLLGISIGVLFNVMFPPWVITTLLCVVLSIECLLRSTVVSSLRRSSRRKELSAVSAAAAATAREVRSAPEAPAPAPSGSVTQPLLSKAAQQPGSSTVAATGTAPLAPAQQLTWRQLVNWTALSELVLVWGLYLVLQVAQSSTEKCSTLYWIIIASQVPISPTATLVAAHRLYSEHERRLAGASDLGDYASEEHQWGIKEIIRFPKVSLATGIIGALLGIGGGMVMAPVLLELGLKPQVVSATSTFIVLFSSSLAVTEYYLLGCLPWEVAIYFCSIAIVAALAGLSVVRSYVSRSGKASIFIFLLGGVIGVSGLFMGSLGLAKLYKDWMAGT